MYRIEMIPKESTIQECLTFWTATGREDETPNGQFVFEKVESYFYYDRTLEIRNGDKLYLYNMSDFYRIKIIKLAE
ncbi:MAG: hypothetical protein OQK12_09900 [Motiliproteus sp.]|nr:hypothetical protein [Motiliproteus sp.]MCW9051272.1 hypothetical protein [Motiliproteus sp.]